jgi:hypothetical protein
MPWSCLRSCWVPAMACVATLKIVMTDPSAPSSPSPPNPVGAVVQISCLVCLAAYAMVGLLQGLPLDRWIIIAIGAIGLGARPETVWNLFRRAPA